MSIWKDIKRLLLGEQGKHEEPNHQSSHKDCEKITANRSRMTIASCGNWLKLKSKYSGHRIAVSGYAPFVDVDGDNEAIASASHRAEIVVDGSFNKIATCGGGTRVQSNGFAAIVSCIGADCVASAKKGSWIVLAEWGYCDEAKELRPVYVKAEYVDGERIKADTQYILRDGEFCELYATEENYI